MRMRTIYIGLLMIMLFPCTTLAFSVRAEVDRNAISINESLTLKIVFEDGDGEVDISPITDFQVLSRSSSSNISILNGNYTKTISTIFRLLPLKQGVLTIPSLQVSHKKKIYHTQKITVEVGNASKHSTDAKDIFAEAVLSNDILYTGQQGIYRFRLYSAVQYSNARLQQPSFQGFNAKEVGKRKNYSKVINGRNYDVIEINYVIIPENPGNIEIEPAMVSCDVRVRGNRSSSVDPFFSNDFFSFGRTEQRRLATEPLSVKVSSLPGYQGKIPFSGLVGEFSLKGELDRQTLKTGESATLTVTVSGVGNLMDAQMPEILIPDAFKTYDDEPVDEIALSAKGYSGTRIFKKAIVPVTSGKYTIDPFVFVYYDTTMNQYRKLSTSPITLNVEDAEEHIQSVEENDLTPSGIQRREKKEVAFTGRDILALKEGPEVLVHKKTMPLSVFTILFFLPCILFYLVKSFLIFGRKEPSSSVMLVKKARLNMARAEKKGIDRKDFLRFLHGALTFSVLSRKKNPAQSVTPVEVREILLDTGVKEEVVSQAAELLGYIESVRYGSRNVDEIPRKELLEKLRMILKHIVVFVFICSTALSFPAQTKADDSGTLFLKALSDYRAGNFMKSASAFEKVAENGISNGHLFYNIGNAWLKAGDIGRAVLWYERAKRIIPLDPDLRFNLDYAKGLVQDKRDAAGVDWVGIFFFWKDYLPPGYVSFTAVFLSVVFFAYASIRTLQKKKIFTVAGVLVAGVLILSGATAFYDYYDANKRDVAVITAGKTSVRAGLSDVSTELFVLHSGTIVHIDSRKNGFLKIVFSRDKMGWIPETDAELI